MNRIATQMALGQAFVAALALAACGSVRPPDAPSSATPSPFSSRGVVVLGDSLALSPSRTENFPVYLQERLNAVVPGWTIANASVSGDTTSGGLRRMDEAISSDTRILVLELGANDGLRGVDIATIESNLSSIIERAQTRSISVLLCGMETPPTRGLDYSVQFHRLFRRVAERHRVPLVPFLLEGVALNPDLNGEDVIHPNAAGARRIAETVWPHLEPLIRREAAVLVPVR